jgi:glycosyltransferase involved in cell wall biosynthesis
MKILQVANRTFPAHGGVELHTIMISKKLVERGNEVTLAVFNSLDQRDCGYGVTYERPYFITRPRRPSLPETEWHNGVRILRFPSRIQLLSYYWSPKMLHWLTNHIREFDVVHTHCFRFSNNEFAAIASMLNDFKVPIVFTCHDATLLDYMGWRGRLVDEIYRKTIGRELVKLAGRVIALTETNATELERYLFADPEKIRIVPNGIDFNRYQDLPDPTDLKEKLGDPEQVILYIGRFIGYKNPHALIHAFRKIAIKYPKSHLLMVGKDYGMLNYCKRIACERVTFLENASEDEKLKALALSDVCAIPSSYEGFGIVALEAQAAGVPVVATKLGGLGHVLIDGVTGLYIESPKIEEIVHAISVLLDHPELRQRMAYEGKQFSSKFSWDAVAEKLETVYKELT